MSGDHNHETFRRQDDMLGEDMSPAHEFMLNAITKLDQQVSEHVHPEIGRIVNALEGKVVVEDGEPVITIDGIEVREGGLIANVEQNTAMLADLHHQSHNGGFRVKMSKGLVAILVALIGLVGAVGTAIIQQQRLTDREINRVVQQVLTLEHQQNETTVP